jgi:hypothetical protein
MTATSIVRSIVIVLAIAGIGVVWFGSQQAASAGDASRAAAVCALTVPTLGEGEHAYAGNSKCKTCHIKEYKSWAETKMAKTYEVLKPGERAEAKTKAGLDPEKDYTTDEKCLNCHTVGFGHETGFAVQTDEKKAKKMVKKFGGVGCEACHGPGKEYAKLFKEIQKSKRTYKLEEIQALGLTTEYEATCTACHNDKSPTYDSSNPFKYDPNDRTGMHEVQELKQREG